MKHALRFLFALALSISLPLSPAAAQNSPSTDGPTPLVPANPQPTPVDTGMIDETPGLWFVELSNPPAAEGGSPLALTAELQAFGQQAALAGLQYEQRYTYNTLWNGLAVSVDPSDLGKLGRIPGVKAVFPVDTVAIPKTQPVADPSLATALAMTGADAAQSELGYTGKGVRVAVMDTGIDYNHPDLGGCFGAECRVETGYDFVGDAFDANPDSPTFNPVAVPDDDPDDCNGHGTHVAGIIGADGDVSTGAVRGVAPNVTFAAYRVFGCEGSTTSDVMLAAMERAYADGAQVLNMSIGASFQWPQYPTSRAADRLVELGMVVVASIGNSGASGVYSAGAPGVGRNVIGVASFDNTHVSALTFIANPSGRQAPYLQIADTPAPPASEPTPEIVYNGNGCMVDQDFVDVRDKVVLLMRGVCAFSEKYAKAVGNGAVGVVIYNNTTGLFSGGGVESLGPWAVGISLEDGEALRAAIGEHHALPESEPVRLTFTEERVAAALPTGGQISSFSAYGLAPDLSLKPDVGAPGGYIRSTYPLEKGGYEVLGGTSMASPHVAGAAALLLQARPDLPPRAVRILLQNTADPKLWGGDPSIGILEAVHRQGAGMIQIDDAITAWAHVTPSAIALGESQSGPRTVTLDLYNSRRQDMTFDLDFVNALSTSGTMTPTFWDSDATVTFDSPTVTVPARGKATVHATITPASGPDQAQYGGYLTFDAQGSSLALRVPFAGFAGDYQDIPALTPTINELPWLARLEGGFFTRQPEGAIFTMQYGDIPYLLAHFEHQASRMRIDVINAETGQRLARIYDERYTPRNDTPGGFFAFAWDGYTEQDGAMVHAPDGQYVMRITVLRALGDAGTREHWDVWTSPVFRVAWVAGGF